MTTATATEPRRDSDTVHGLVRKFRMRPGKMALGWNPWNGDIEDGDYCVDAKGALWRCDPSRGRNKRDAGELTPVRIKPPKPGLVARIIKSEIWWCLPNDALKFGEGAPRG